MRRRARAEEIVRAQGFATIDASKHFAHHRCASIGEYGLRFGFGARQAREYAAAGRVMALCPMAAEMVLAGGIAVPSLAVIEPYFVDAELRPTTVSYEAGSPSAGEHVPQPFEEILRWARLLPEHELRRAVNWTRAKVRIGERPAICTLHLTNQGVEDLERTREIVARKEGRVVSQSEAAERALRFYVHKHDPQETTPGTRRSDPMPARADGEKNPRTLPAEVRRALLARYGDVCAIGFCHVGSCQRRIWLENSHHLAHALGGGNEILDLDRICSVHHKMKDHGEIRWVPHPTKPLEGHYLTLEGEFLRLKPAKGSGPPAEGAGREDASLGEHSPGEHAQEGDTPVPVADSAGLRGDDTEPPTMVREWAPPYRASRGVHRLSSRALSSRALGSRAGGESRSMRALGGTGLGRDWPGSTEPGSTEPGSAEPGSAEPGSAEPGRAAGRVDRGAPTLQH